MRHENFSTLHTLKSSVYAFFDWHWEWLHENGFASDKGDVELRIDCEVQSLPMLHTALERCVCVSMSLHGMTAVTWNGLLEHARLLLINLKKFDQDSFDIDKSKSESGHHLRWWHYDLLSENCFT